MGNPLGLAAGWLGLAVVLVLMVQVVPASNRPVQWTLGLVLVYLVLTNVDKWEHIISQLVGHLNPATA